MRDLSPVVFRGEYTGKLKPAGGYLSPYFFAENYDQAALYAGRGTVPVAAVVHGKTVLDLTALDYTSPVHRKLMEDLTAEFDDWTCRYSGEPIDAWSLLETGGLYDYEGTGSGERWKSLLNLALDDFDAVRVLDATDGTRGQAVPVWVTREVANVRKATFGEELSALLAARPWPEVQRWLEREHGGLLDRISRLRIVDADYRLDNLQNILPADEFKKIVLPDGHLPLWRALPQGGEIRPGDWVALEPGYAARHQREQDNGVVKSLARVSPDDVYWAGTDSREFFFLPQAWRIQAPSIEAYLKALTPDQVRMLCDGELSRITRFSSEIELIRGRVMASFDPEACGDYHGPDHWNRVNEHAMAVARSLGVDPLVPHLFALVHDSKRHDDGVDPEHGPRAAQFIRDHREDLFGFLPDDDVQSLAYACKYHSDGMTQAPLLVQACWDADRLDLWRVGIEPAPEYLCTSYAQRNDVIEGSLFLLRQLQPDQFESKVSSPHG